MSSICQTQILETNIGLNIYDMCVSEMGAVQVALIIVTYLPPYTLYDFLTGYLLKKPFEGCFNVRSMTSSWMRTFLNFNGFAVTLHGYSCRTRLLDASMDIHRNGNISVISRTAPDVGLQRHFAFEILLKKISS